MSWAAEEREHLPQLARGQILVHLAVSLKFFSRVFKISKSDCFVPGPRRANPHPQAGSTLQRLQYEGPRGKVLRVFVACGGEMGHKQSAAALLSRDRRAG